ncbi:Proteasomal ubiquitin receptor ADRM1 [Halotydeus destructor]|nr:Proteasomal ubiquitin receptor ADRM1 [Halotydeus destructor]
MSRPPFLFGNNASTATQSKHLVEFKAGKMTMKGTTVQPIKKKGTVYLHQSDDSLMHFCWKDRTSGQTDEDLILFPDDAEFKRVEQCKTGRVYVLKFKSSNKRHFYWMQEPKEEKDEEFCTKINEYLSHPPPPGSRSSGTASGLGALGNLAELGADADLQTVFNNMSQQQLMQMLGGVVGMSNANLAGLLGASGGAGSGTGSGAGRARNSGATSSATATPAVTSPSTQSTTASTTTPAPAAAAGAAGSAASAIQVSDLQSIISGLSLPEQPRENVNVDLSTSINYEALQPLLSNDDFMKRVKEHLPPTVDAAGNQTPVSGTEARQHFSSTISSPQFRQALSIFSGALQSGQLGPLIQQFGLSSACVNAANEGNLETFVKALEASEKEKKDSGKKDEDMALD